MNNNIAKNNNKNNNIAKNNNYYYPCPLVAKKVKGYFLSITILIG